MLNLLDEFRQQLVPQAFRAFDARANPKYWNNYWTSWQTDLDDDKQSRSHAISMYLFSNTFLLISVLKLFVILR